MHREEEKGKRPKKYNCATSVSSRRKEGRPEKSVKGAG
jgi:hypothetical protein